MLTQEFDRVEHVISTFLHLLLQIQWCSTEIHSWRAGMTRSSWSLLIFSQHHLWLWNSHSMQPQKHHRYGNKAYQSPCSTPMPCPWSGLWSIIWTSCRRTKCRSRWTQLTTNDRKCPTKYCFQNLRHRQTQQWWQQWFPFSNVPTLGRTGQGWENSRSTPQTCFSQKIWKTEIRQFWSTHHWRQIYSSKQPSKAYHWLVPLQSMPPWSHANSQVHHSNLLLERNQRTSWIICENLQWMPALENCW